MDSKKQTSALIIIYEFILGLFELTFGALLVLFWDQLITVYSNLSAGELLEDSNDLMVRVTETFIPNLFAHRYYIAALLVALGIVKIVSAIGLIYKKEWAKHLLVGLLVILVPFDLIGMIRHFSIFDLAYLLIDLLIILYLIDFDPKSYISNLRSLKHNS